MRINLYLLFLLLFVHAANAQNRVREKTDALAPLIQRYYNNNAYDSVYALGGTGFQQEISQEKFREVMRGVQAQLGSFAAFTFESVKDNVAKYKADFANATLTLLLGVDSTGKLETFLFQQYESEPVATKEPVPFSNPLVSALDLKTDSIAKAFMAKANTAGLAIGVLENGKNYYYNYGETVKGNRKVPNEKTLYEIGSITKTFTGILLAYFVEQKKVKLDDPINKYLPDSIPAITYNGKPVTLASLSNHSSGLPRLPSNFWQGATNLNPYKHYDNPRLFSFLKNHKLVREPGSQYEYSNLAVGLLGVILERVSGKPYEQLVKEIIWQPLKMNATRITLLKNDSAIFAQAYGGQLTVHSWEFQSLAAAGAIRSSTSDMLLYAAAQMNTGNSTLQKAIALSHQMTFEKNNQRVALGWHLIINQEKKYVFHNGQTGGYYTILVVNPASKRAVVMLTNALVDPMGSATDLMIWLDKQI